MPSTRRHTYNLNFKLKIVAEEKAVNNNCEIAREYGLSESMVRKWRNQQHVLFSGELKMTAKRASMGRYRPKDPEVDQQLVDWFSNQRSQGKNWSLKWHWWLEPVNISPTSCLCWPFAVNRWSHCFYIFRSRSEQHHDSAKGEGTQLRSRLQGFPWLRYTKWKRRHAISMRSKTTLAQGLPADMEDKVVGFHRFVVRAEWRR